MDLSIIDLLMYLRKFQSIDFSIYRTISLSIYIYIYLSICLSVCPSVHPSVCPSTHPSIHSSIYLYCVFSCHILPSLFYSSVLDSILSNLIYLPHLISPIYPILSSLPSISTRDTAISVRSKVPPSASGETSYSCGPGLLQVSLFREPL